MDIGIAGSDQTGIAERRYLTIVFCDLVGYTALSEQLDPEDLRELLLRYQRCALTVVEKFGGFVASFSGDGILIYFGYPSAHENDAERAVRAALELIERVPALDVTVGHGAVPSLAIRIGVHTGIVVIGPEQGSRGRHEHGIVGEAPNLAARLKDEATPNSVVVTKETLELIAGLFESESLGARRVKGLSREIAVHKITKVVYSTSRSQRPWRTGASRMVGRQRELERLLAHWRKTAQDQRGAVVQIVGEAGVGKTRLVLELCQQPEFANATVLRMNCQELFAGTPLYPVASFLWARLGLAAEEDEAARIRRISAWLDDSGVNTPANVGIVASLLGLALSGTAKVVAPTPLLVKPQQFAFLISLLGHRASLKPTLLWIEDAHWLDPSSAELLPELVAGVTDARVLVLLTLRSFPKGPTLPPPDDIIRLEQLEVEQSLELARSIPGADAVSADMLSRAVEASDGTPLFLEQLVLSLINQGAQTPALGRGHGSLPLTLAEMMSERLDRLQGGRHVVQTAACIGRSFAPDFLGGLLEEPRAQVMEALEALVEAEILWRRLDGAGIAYEFRHALLQRVAYESIVQADRRILHARIADALKQHAGGEPTIPEVLAHHLTAAKRPEEAIKAWREAGVSATRRSAHVEAIAHLRRGIALLDEIAQPPLRRQLELNLQASLIGPLIATQGATSDDFSATCRAGLQLAMEGEPTPLIFPFLFGQFTFAVGRGRVGESVAAAEHFLSLANHTGYDSGQVVGHRLVGMVRLHEGEAWKAKAHLERSLELYSPERDAAATDMFGQNTQIHSRSLLSLVLFCLGEVDRALEVGLDAVAAALALRHPHSTALALGYVGGWIFGLCGAKDEMGRVARHSIAVSEQHRLGAWRRYAETFLGWAFCQQGDLERGIAVIEPAIAAQEASGFYLTMSGSLAILADAKRRRGQLRSAQALCARAVTMVCEGRDARWLEPEVRRIEALVARDLNPQEPAQAAAMLKSAVECARRLGFPVFELRCLISLSEVLGEGNRDAAVEQHIRELSHLRDLEARAIKAVAERAAALGKPGVGLDGW
jgi:class 3 adenylate cyclase